MHENKRPGSNGLLGKPLCYFQQVRGRGDAEILRLAGLQHGHLLRSQLLEAGVGRGALNHRVETGWIVEVLPSVYRLGGRQEERLGRLMATALSFRGHALIAGRASASLWQILDATQEPPDHAPIEVLLVARSSKPRPGVVIHRVKALARQDVRSRRGIPVTSPARTILDLAATMPAIELEAVLAAAFRKQLVSRSDVVDVLARNPNVKGIRALRALLEQSGSLRDTRSVYERKLLALLREAELPLPQTNVMVAGKLVDGLWPDLKLIFEFDGWLYHRDKFESDRLRDQLMLIAGHRVIRISGRQIDFAPYALIARLASIITALRLNREAAQAVWVT